MYLAAFLLTLSPTAVGFQGGCNLFCYALQSSYHSSQCLQGNGCAPEAMVRDFERWAGTSSVPVGFNQKHDEAVVIASDQRIAWFESERETRTLQGGRRQTSV